MMRKGFMLLATLLCSWQAWSAEAKEPSTAMSALELRKSCYLSSPECLAYVTSVRDWMLSSPETFGPLCNAKDTGPDMLGTMYFNHTNQPWIRQANARDMAVWIFQGMFMCHIQKIADPGQPGFPTRLR